MKTIVHPKISIITICFNAETVIEETIRSVINQSYPNFEYIIIDGGSTDNTLSIINKYKQNIDIIVSEPDNGVYNAMNKGIDKATGTWLNFMNAGDCFAGTKVIEKVFSKEFPDNAAFLYADAWLKTKNGLKLHQVSIEEGVILHQSCIYKKELHYRYGYYNEFKPIVISDYLFFCNVPVELFYKVKDVQIAIYDMTGISTQKWNLYQKLCADYIFNRKSMTHLIIKVIFNDFLHFIPINFRNTVKKIIK